MNDFVWPFAGNCRVFRAAMLHPTRMVRSETPLPPDQPSKPELLRVLGRWTLTALVINSIIGSGIFGLPSAIAKLLGPLAPLAYVLGALAIGVIMAVFAEVGSQFRESGGQYLYARTALGRFAGIQVGWFFLLVRITSGAAVLNLFVNYLAEFWPAATAPLARAILMFALVAGLTVVNYRGVRAGAGLSNFFTITKVSSLGLFIIAGMVLAHRVQPLPAATPITAGGWIDALVALVFAFGGFESALIPAAEVKNPRKDTPFALGFGLVVIAACYFLVHVVAMWSVADLASSPRPLADAARAFGGSGAAAAMAIAAMLSAYGWASGAFITLPRLIFALAERGDFPRQLAAVHARFRTPHVAIVFWAVALLALSIYGTFMWNALLAAVARLVTWGMVCAALIQLRRRNPQADAWRAPAGNLLAVLGLGFCIVLVLSMTTSHAISMAAVAVIAATNWLFVRARVSAATTPETA
jgi:basic amino acid/polyamine antiporter, APA family